MILPPAFAFMVSFIKDTALVSQIGVIELTFAGKVLNNEASRRCWCSAPSSLLYFALSYPLTRLGRGWSPALPHLEIVDLASAYGSRRSCTASP